MPRIGKEYRWACPKCATTDVRMSGFEGMLGRWPHLIRKRRYKCRGCGHTWHTIELEDVLMDYFFWPPPSEGD